MGDEKKDEGAGDPIKILLKEALEKQRNVMMDNFTQIDCPLVVHLHPAATLEAQPLLRYK
jgi:hypothetical protein